MKIRSGALRLLLVLTFAPAFAPWASAEDASPPLHFGGCGGVYFLLEPGTFWVEVSFASHRRGDTTYMRVLLASPGRDVLKDEYLVTGPDAPERTLRIETDVPAKGIYALNITMPNDRYGTKAAWGFETNAQRYIVETSRGHRDEPHTEPLDLQSPDRPGDVCFRAERGAFTIDITGYPPQAAPPTLFNAAEERLGVLTPDAEGAARFTVAEDVPRGEGPWRLHLPAFAGTLHIDGVTRWPRGSDYPDFSLWTPHRDAWFALHENRWPITPYQRRVYVEDAGTTEFEVHNNAAVERRFELAIEFPEAPWDVELGASEVTVDPGEALPVPVTLALPDGADAATCRIRVTPEDTSNVTTYASLAVQRGIAPAEAPLDMPLVLQPYQHESAQFGYAPDYPLHSQVYFDPGNRPFMTAPRALVYGDGGAWRETEFADGNRRFQMRSSKVAFDESGAVYTIGQMGDTNHLLHSSDGGATLAATPIPGCGVLDIAQYSGHNTTAEPSPFVRYVQTARDPDRIWRRINNLDLFVPRRNDDGAITIPEPVRVSELCIGFSAHSGIPSSVVARVGKVHVAWGEAADPEEDVPGVPTYAATYDVATGKLSEPALIGYGPPANDVHNTPCITIDSEGYLHVLIGTHGRTFKYARSLESNNAAAGWTEAEDIGPGLRQTYVGLVCGPDDTLHCVFRLWCTDGDYFPTGHYATLGYMRKRPGEPWSEVKPLVIAAFADYSIFYHRLTIDRRGRLFLSYDYWSTYWFYRNDHPGNRRALMMSPDGGDTWRLATSGDLRP